MSLSNGTSHVQELDALIVGAGFGGVYQLRKLRLDGYSTKIVDTASDFGGVWYWNRYPGARVDSTTPHYEFSDPDLWADWKWKQRFPGSAELRAYFEYVAEKWDLRKDTIFNTSVQSANWSNEEKKWLIRCSGGATFKAKFLLLNVGFAAKRHTPDWPGIDKFKGTWVHPSYWPKKEPDLTGKKVAVIGTGATGVQIAQEVSQVAAHMVLFQRTPNLALPMKQVNYSGEDRTIPVEKYPALMDGRVASFGGFNFNFLPRATFDDEPAKRKEVYQALWEEGDFHFWLATYYDMLFVKEANVEAYNFWRDQTRPRIKDPRARDILAPMIQPHAFGCKRVSLENGYYEIFNQPNVDIVDVNATPIVEVTENGIRTTEKEWDFDYVICATGFDAITGSLNLIDIRGKDGTPLSEKWSEGTKTYLGMAVSGFPNMFFTYGPQAPTPFCNGPTCAELQGEWIVAAMNEMRQKRQEEMSPTASSEEEWAKNIWTLANATLLPSVDSWYMGTNVPGKVREPLMYLGGVPKYYETIGDCAKAGYQGFEVC